MQTCAKLCKSVKSTTIDNMKQFEAVVFDISHSQECSVHTLSAILVFCYLQNIVTSSEAYQPTMTSLSRIHQKTRNSNEEKYTIQKSTLN